MRHVSRYICAHSSRGTLRTSSPLVASAPKPGGGGTGSCVGTIDHCRNAKAAPDQHLLPVEGDAGKCAHAVDVRHHLSRCVVVAKNRKRRRQRIDANQRRLREEDRAGGRRRRRRRNSPRESAARRCAVRSGRSRSEHLARGRRLGRGLGRCARGRRPAHRFVARDRLIVALQRHRRRVALVQYGGIDVVRGRVLVALHIERVRGEAGVRTREKVQILSVLIEGGAGGVAHAVGDLVRSGRPAYRR